MTRTMSAAAIDRSSNPTARRAADAFKSSTAMKWPRRLVGVAALGALAMLAGCATLPADIQARCDRGYVFYLDGAGGSDALTDWSGGIRDGLRDAGYPGWGEGFRWQTGLGAAVDQVASNHYKRAKAAELARKILRFRQEHPDAQVDLVGFSAGTVIAVYALEALPDEPTVDNVVLLSSSLSADYELTAALTRVRQNAYIFTSSRDVILTVLLPLSGPADRGADTNRVIGVSGPIMPRYPSVETASQYTKLVEVRWNPSFQAVGNRGGHLDVLSSDFVRTHVAPLLVAESAAQDGTSGPRRTVRNPDYQCWAPFPPGSWAVLEGTCTRDGRTEACRIKSTLISMTANSAVVQHELTINGKPPEDSPCAWRSIVRADADPEAHPLTSPHSQVTRSGPVDMIVLGKPTSCDVAEIVAPGGFAFWGRNVRAEIRTASTVPGYLVRLDLRTEVEGRRYEFALRMTAYSVGGTSAHQACRSAYGAYRAGGQAAVCRCAGYPGGKPTSLDHTRCPNAVPIRKA